MHIKVENLGQIKEADISFGDFTVFVGPQASGKSIFLQIFKLLIDYDTIKKTIKKYGLYWERTIKKYDLYWEKENDFLFFFLGEGMNYIWNKDTRISYQNRVFDLEKALNEPGKKEKEDHLFYIPAQRVLTISNGWPRNFMDFEIADPFVVKYFSEQLRQLMEAGLGKGKAIFPQVGRMKKNYQDMINQSIFHGLTVKLDSSFPRKRIVIQTPDKHDLPFMTWSAGQREFIPLLLGLYWLLPRSRISKRKSIQWVVIEEPEMDLHPQAILSLLMITLELLYRGYKVILSTHTPLILDVIWAINILKEKKSGEEKFLEIFGLKKSTSLKSVAKEILCKKMFKTYYFTYYNDQGIKVKDISSLDPGNIDKDVWGWGGLTEFSGKIGEVVAQVVLEV